MFGASDLKGFSSFWDYGLTEEYTERTSSYMQRTIHVACTLSVRMSMPIVLTDLVFALFRPQFGSLPWISDLGRGGCDIPIFMAKKY